MPQPTEGTLTPSERITRKAQIKMAADCSTATDPFINLNHTSPQKAVELLRWFSDVRQKAGGDGELKVDVECRSELQPNPCLNGARQVLAGLPLEGIYVVGRDPQRRHEEETKISIKPEDMSNLYWQLDIFRWSTDRPRLRISWAVIPPF